MLGFWCYFDTFFLIDLFSARMALFAIVVIFCGVCKLVWEKICLSFGELNSLIGSVTIGGERNRNLNVVIVNWISIIQ